MTREQILAKKDTTPFRYASQEGDVYLKRFTGCDAAAWREFVAGSIEGGRIKYPALFRAKLVQLSLCDAAGKLLFEGEDVPHITTLQSSFIEEIFVASTRLNKLSEDATEAARVDFSATQKNGTGTA